MEYIQSILNKQAKWHGRSLQGCLYASYIYNNIPFIEGFERICLLEKVSVESFSIILKLINEKFNDSENYAISITLPNCKTYDDLSAFVNLCKNEPGWSVNDKKIYRNLRLVKIRIPLPSLSKKQDISFAWVLGFGPFNFFPDTRQSPFFEILLPTKSKSYLMKRFDRISPKKQCPFSIERGGKETDAHIADIYIDGITNNPKIDSVFWNSSINRKHQLLTNSETSHFDDTSAKAKITFSLPV